MTLPAKNIFYSNEFDVTPKDVCLYALGVGAARGPVFANRELKFVYEGHPQFSPLPTLACSFPFMASGTTLSRGSLAQRPSCRMACLLTCSRNAR